ncbi:MAG TPA: hypothetical protein VMY05_03665 [Acidobacteriota bacterium]|nr:hypothetical protein [Acidobacteriota bacterium]
MKINAVAIQSYQQLNRQSRPDSVPAEKAAGRAAEKTVTIEPQDETQSSKLAVKARGGSYAKFLTDEERQALDLLFSRFRDTGRFGASYRAETDADEGSPVGRLIDVKV